MTQTESNFFNRYNNIWEQTLEKNTNFNEVVNRGFTFQFDGDKNPDILFLGINPSFDNKDIKVKECYKNSIQNKSIPYFKAFYRIKESLLQDHELETVCTHLDLCAFRETRQSFIKDVLFKSKDGVEFIFNQLQISKEIIEEIKPKVIVCSNTMARELLGRDRGVYKNGNEYGVWLGYQFKFNKELGTDVFSGNSESKTQLKGTPIFFTSMLSGQRAIDNGSKERLIWHINEALQLVEKSKENN